MLDHWERSGPPTYISAAAYLGLGGKASKDNAAATDEEKYGNLEELAAMFGDTGGQIGG